MLIVLAVLAGLVFFVAGLARAAGKRIEDARSEDRYHHLSGTPTTDHTDRMQMGDRGLPIPVAEPLSRSAPWTDARPSAPTTTLNKGRRKLGDLNE